MKITIEPTEHFFMAGEVMVRAWRGTDDLGVPITALVSGVRVEGPEQVGEAEGLVSIPPPTPDDARRWAEEVMRRAERPPAGS